MPWRSQIRSGLPVLVGVYLPLTLFLLLAIVTQAYPNGLPWELPILIQMHRLAQPDLDAIVLVLTNLGVYWGVLPVAVAISMGLFWQKRWRSLLYVGLTLVGTAAINRTAKWLFHRERPHLWDGFLEQGFAFPSGHAMASMTLVMALIWLTIGSRWFWPTLVWGGGFVGMIGWTRLYLGVHYPSDILAGWLLSVAWTIGCGLLILSRRSIVADPKPSRSKSPAGELG